MQKNLLKAKPECHRALFEWKEGSKSPKESFTLQDLLEYYAISYYHGAFYGNFATVQQMENLRNAAIKSAPSWDDDQLANLENLVEKFGLEITLYAIDLVETNTYPSVNEIKSCIPDAENVLASLIRTRDYGV
jgi:hypothetical protein